jgi:hypothetical protein
VGSEGVQVIRMDTVCTRPSSLMRWNSYDPLFKWISFVSSPPFVSPLLPESQRVWEGGFDKVEDYIGS